MRRLHLSDRDKKIAGVCGGMGESLGIGSDIVRIAFVLATVFGGVGIVVYIALMLILPKEGDPQIIDVEPIPDSEADEPEKERLYRSSRDRIAAGVCGGVAEYTGWDVSLIRLGFILLTLMSGLGLVLYLIMWLVMPLREDAA